MSKTPIKSFNGHPLVAESTGTVEVDTTLTQAGMAADAATVGEKISDLSEEKADKAYMVALFEELKALIQGGDIDGAIALLDRAILDNSVLA